MNMSKETLKCPFCKGTNYVKHGLSSDRNRQRYTCICGKNFFVSLVQLPKMVVPIVTRNRRPNKPKVSTCGLPCCSIDGPTKCPRCEGTELRKNGKQKDGRQRYKCKNKSCNAEFTYPHIEQTYRGRIAGAPTKTKAELIKANRVVHLSHLTVDNVNDTPCFISCEARFCNPVTCNKLSQYLNGPNIEEYVPREQEFECTPDRDYAFSRGQT